MGSHSDRRKRFLRASGDRNHPQPAPWYQFIFALSILIKYLPLTHPCCCSLAGSAEFKSEEVPRGALDWESELWSPLLALPLTEGETLGKSPPLFEPQFPHVQSEGTAPTSQ